MKSMKGAFWIVSFFLILSMLFEITYAKSGGSYSGSYSGGSYSGGSYSGYSGGSRYYSGGYYSGGYYSGGYNRGYYYSSYSSSSSGGLTGLWSFLGVCCCVCMICMIAKRYRRNGPLTSGYTEPLINKPAIIYPGAKTAPASEYHAAVIYSMQNPPQVSPPDFTGEVRMLTDPSASSAVRNSVHINVFGNTVRFVYNQNVEDRCIQSNVRIMGYYEVTITNIENQVCLALGYATKPYPPFRLPGWEKHSVAYHSDNGNKFFNDPGNGMQYGPRYGAGDIIGCGYTNSPNGNQVFFFTRNGQHLGIAFTTNYLMGETFAIIGADGPCSMSVNFGNDVNRPFSCQAINFGTIRGPTVQMGIPVNQPTVNVQIVQQQPYVGQPEGQILAPSVAHAPPQGQNTGPQPSIYSGAPSAYAPSAYAPTQYQSSVPPQSIPNQIQSGPPPTYSSTQNQNVIPQQSFPIEGQPSTYAPTQIQSSIPPQPQRNIPYQPPPNQYPASNQYQAPSLNQYTIPPPNQQPTI